MDSCKNIQNKKIFQAKIAVTNNCVLQCDYCFVEKQKQTNVMSWDVSKKAVDLILENGTGQKIIKIYGGEPLLCFDLVKDITAYIRSKERKDSPVQLSLCTNAVLLEQSHLDFLRDNAFQLAISINGARETHDKHRKFPDGRGTFESISKKLPLVIKTMGVENIAANVSVVSSEVDRLFYNFQAILSEGFDTLNLEPVFGYGIWNAQARNQFVAEMKKIIKYIHENMLKGKYAFLATVNREIHYKTLSRFITDPCPFVQCLEVQPDGELSLIPFIRDFETHAHDKYFVGNLASGRFSETYASCSYRQGDVCNQCLRDNFFDDGSDAGGIVGLRNKLSIEYVKLLYASASRSSHISAYIDQAKKHICF